MRTVDFSPLFRSAIGFDRLFDLAEAAQRVGEESYPPYNIERLDENSFQISVALAGFKPDEVELTVEQNVLTLEGRKNDKEARPSCIAASRRATSSASSPSPTMSRSGALGSRTAC
jgi:molecular chaperone IbpA